MSGDGSEVVRLDQRVPFTMVDNPIIRALDDYVALGLYVDMLSWPPGWRINLRELARTHKQGRQVLTSAMNDLIERGLVFRVRYQQAGGLWMTRTYVCARAVTEAELLDVRAQFLGRCRIETSAALSARVNPGSGDGAPSTTGLQVEGQGDDGDSPGQDAAEGSPVPSSPSARFPAPGTPASGSPTVGRRTSGRPTVGRRARQRSDPRPKTPPPDPPQTGSVQPPEVALQVEEELEGPPPPRSPSSAALDPGLHEALLAAWPTLTDGAIRRLAPDLATGVETIGLARLVEHLTTNTGGALNAAAVVRSRLRDLPRARPRRHLPAWCGQCTSPEYRWIEESNEGQPLHPCPRCSAQAAARTAATR